MKSEVGAYEAKTRLPELLRQVRAGRRYTITHRGKAIAELRPAAPVPTLAAAAAIDRYLEFKRTHPVKGRVNLEALMAEGRE